MHASSNHNNIVLNIPATDLFVIALAEGQISAHLFMSTGTKNECLADIRLGGSNIHTKQNKTNCGKK